MPICVDCHEEIPEAIDEGRDQCTTCYIDMLETSLLTTRAEMEHHQTLADARSYELNDLRGHLIAAREDLKRETRALAA
jgi:hypothetical protein